MGIYLAAWTAWRMARRSFALVRHGVRTTGRATVVMQPCSTVEYSVGALTYKITSWWHLPSAVGSEVPVVYLPDSAARGCINHVLDLWMPPLLWLLVAVFFGVLDVWY
jgi:hypothetical protein